MSKAKEQLCECGCGKLRYWSQLVEVVVEEATDKTLRQIKVRKRFHVTKECREPFTEELQLDQALQILVWRWRPKPKTLRQKLNVFQTLYLWWMRVGSALRVMRIVHARHERVLGFKAAHDRAIQSAVLFGAPRFMQGFLASYFLRRQEKEKENAARPELAVVKA